MSSISFQIRYIASNCQKINCSRLSRDSTNSAVRRGKNWRVGRRGGGPNRLPKAQGARGSGASPQKTFKCGGSEMLLSAFSKTSLQFTRIANYFSADWIKYITYKVNYKTTKPTISQANVLPVRDSESGISSLLNCVALEANADSIERLFYGYLFFLTLTLRK